MINQESLSSLTFQNEVFNLNIKNTVEKLLTKGYGHLQPDFYLTDNYSEELREIQDSYMKIQGDCFNKGGRNRAYHCLTLKEGKFFNSTSSYAQSAEYNMMDGGKKRNFPEINERLLNTNLFRKLLMLDVKICKETELIEFKDTVSIGIHQIRYFATAEQPAYSTPVWLHRDDETIVFIHFFGQNSSAIGGTNYIAKSSDEIIKVLHLTEPLETLILSKKYMHSLSPIGVKPGEKEAYRDVLILTFESDKDFQDRLKSCYI